MDVAARGANRGVAVQSNTCMYDNPREVQTGYDNSSHKQCTHHLSSEHRSKELSKDDSSFFCWDITGFITKLSDPDFVD